MWIPSSTGRPSTFNSRSSTTREEAQSSPLGSGNIATVSNQYNTNATGVYWRNVIHSTTSPWTFIPGFRLSYYNLTNEYIPDPRVAVRYGLGSGWTLRGASGFYDEAPPVYDMDAVYGNPNLKSQRAIHGSIGYEKKFSETADTEITVTNDFFYKYLYNLVASSTAFVSPSQPLYYDNSGYGHVYGMELMGKFRGSRWQSWIAYTLSRSTRGDNLTPESLFAYDQTHLLTVVGDLQLGRNWKLSARVRYTTGDPYTPIIAGILDVDNDTYTPIRGPIYSQRIGPFFQTDIRLDKKWVYNTWMLSVYLDIENVTNNSNPQAVLYSYNYQQSTTISGLPIFPTLGLKVEF